MRSTKKSFYMPAKLIRFFKSENISTLNFNNNNNRSVVNDVRMKGNKELLTKPLLYHETNLKNLKDLNINFIINKKPMLLKRSITINFIPFFVKNLPILLHNGRSFKYLNIHKDAFSINRNKPVGIYFYTTRALSPITLPQKGKLGLNMSLKNK